MVMTLVIDDSDDVMEGGDLVFGMCKSWWCLMMVMVNNVQCAQQEQTNIQGY